MKLFAPAAAVVALALALAGCANPENADQPEAAPAATGSAFPATVATKFVRSHASDGGTGKRSSSTSSG